MRQERVTIGAEGAANRGNGLWFVEWPARIAPMIDLICFAGAGAGASVFRPWVDRLPAYTTVLACQLPGRENRIGESPAGSMACAADHIVAEYRAIRTVDRPFVLFGHSMGGALAFEVASRLAATGQDASGLYLSATTPPSTARDVTSLDDQTLRALLLGYDPENRKITGSEELFAALAPVLGSDIEMLRRHEMALGTARLDVNAHLLSGKSDEIVPDSSVARWAEYFRKPASRYELEGGHFFPFRESQGHVLELLAGTLRETVTRRKRL